MGRGKQRTQGNATEESEDCSIATLEGWEEGVPFRRELTRLNRWELQAADRLTVHIGKHDVVLVQDPHSSLLGGYIWLSSIVFCTYLEGLHSKPDRRSWMKLDWDKRWVELGSGVGLIGLLLCKLGVNNVTITDIEELVPTMERNAQANGVVVKSIGGRRGHEAEGRGVVVEPLLWNEREAIERVRAAGEIDYIVASDCIYSETSAEDLVATMDQLSSENTTVICVTEVRNQAAQARFLEEASSCFINVELIPESSWRKKAGSIAFEETVNLYRLRKTR